jgi:hypothetical protein
VGLIGLGKREFESQCIFSISVRFSALLRIQDCTLIHKFSFGALGT